MKIKGARLLAVVIVLCVATGAQAVSDSWKSDASASWNVAGSWTGGNIPGSLTVVNSDIATFSVSLLGDRTVTVDSPRYIGGITLGNTSSYKYTLSGGSLRLNSGGVIQSLAATGKHVDAITTSIQIEGASAATATFTANASSPSSWLSIGAVMGSATAGNTTTLTLNGSNTSVNLVTGVVSNGPSGGVLALVKEQAGCWALTGTNSYTGGTTVNAGTLIAKKTASLPNYSTTGTIAGNNTAVRAVNGGLASPAEWSSAEIDNLLANGNVTFAAGTLFGIDTTSTNFTCTTALTNRANLGLIKLGSRTLTLTGANTYEGGTTVKAGFLAPALTNSLPGYTTPGKVVINGGTLTATLGDGVTTGWSTAQVDALLANATKTKGALGIDTSNGDQTQWTALTTGNLGGALGLAKVGANRFVLNQANTYVGPTTVNFGTLALSSVNNCLPSTGSVIFDGETGSTATLDIGATSQTLSNILFTGTAGQGSIIKANIAGTGTLTVNGNSDLNFGVPLLAIAGDVNNPIRIDVDMSGLANFIYTNVTKTFRAGYYDINSRVRMSVSATNGVVTLAATNAITAATLAVHDSSSASGAGSETLRLGKANTLNVTTINMGTGQRNTSLLDFAAPGSTATVRGVTGGSSAVSSWNIGKLQDNANTRFWTNTVDFSSGTVDISVTNLVIALADVGTALLRTGNAIGKFTMADGVLNVTSLVVGRMMSGGGTVGNIFTSDATFTLNGGTVNGTAVILAENTITDGSSNTKTVSGTFNLLSGALNATTVKKGLQTGTATATTAFNWTTGTIGNISGSDLLWTNVPLTLLTTAAHTFNISDASTATMDAASPISGATFGITKIGTGTLKLCATNTYSGGTIVSNGTLVAGRDNALASGSALILSGGAFDAGSFSNDLSTLTLSDGAASQLLVNSGACALSCTGMTGTGTLSVIGTLGATSVKFGSNKDALTSEQLSRIKINGRRTALTSQGYLQEEKGTLIQFL